MMKRLLFTLALGSSLGLAPWPLAAQSEPPGTNASTQTGWSTNAGDINGIKCLNSDTTTPNPFRTLYWFLATDTKGNLTPTADGRVKISGSPVVYLGAGVATDVISGGVVDRVRAATNYYVYAQACPDGVVANGPNCSAWTLLRPGPIRSQNLPTNVFINPVAGDVTTNAITVRSSVPDPANVQYWQLTMDDLDANTSYTINPPSSFNSTPVLTVNDTLYTPGFKRNTKYQYRGQLQYYWEQLTSMETKGPFYTTPATPGVSGSDGIKSVTYFTATVQFHNSGESPNPTGTQFEVGVFQGAAQIQSNLSAISATGNASETFAVKLTGLSPGTTYTAKARARNRGRPTWSDSPWITIGSFTTNSFSLAITPMSVTENSAALRFTVTSAAGLDHIVIRRVNDNGTVSQPWPSGQTVFDYTMTGLLSNRTYDVQAQLCESVDGSACSAWLPSTPARFTTQPASPLASGTHPVDLVAAAPTSITAYWADPSNPAGTAYSFKICSGAGFTTCNNVASPTSRGNSTEQSAVISGLVANTAYQISIKAVNAQAPTWPDSNYFVFNSNPVTTPPYDAALTVASVTPTSAKLTITPNDSNNLKSFEIQYRQRPSGSWVLATNPPINWQGGTAQSYTLTGLSPNVDYEVQVRLTDQAGQVGSWLPITPTPFTTQAASPLPSQTQPIDLVATSPTSITAYWADPSNPVGTGYSFRICSGAGFAACNDVATATTKGSSSELSAVLSEQSANTTYKISIKALNKRAPAWPDSGYFVFNSNPVTTPSYKSELTVNSVDATSAKLTIKPDDTHNLKSFEIQYRERPAGSWVLATNPPIDWQGGASRKFTLAGLSPNTRYEVQVRLTDNAGKVGGWLPTAPVPFTTQPAIPLASLLHPEGLIPTPNSLIAYWRDSLNPNGTLYRFQVCKGEGKGSGSCKDVTTTKSADGEQSFEITDLNPETIHSAFLVAVNLDEPTWPNSDPLNFDDATTPAIEDLKVMEKGLTQKGFVVDDTEVCTPADAKPFFRLNRDVDLSSITGAVRIEQVFRSNPISGWTVNYDNTTRQILIEPPPGGWPALIPIKIRLTRDLKDLYKVNGKTLKNEATIVFVSKGDPSHAHTASSFVDVSAKSFLQVVTGALDPDACTVLRTSFRNPANGLTVDINKAKDAALLKGLPDTVEVIHIKNGQVTKAPFKKPLTLRIASTSGTNRAPASAPSLVPIKLVVARVNPDTGILEEVQGSAQQDAGVQGQISEPGVYRIAQTHQSNDVSQAYAYPVPYKSTMGLPGVTFTNLGAESHIRIYTITGRLVQEMSPTLGQHQSVWDIKNWDGENVASGVYLYVIESPGGKKDGKLVIIQ